MRATLGGGVFWAVAPTISSASFECPFRSFVVTCIQAFHTQEPKAPPVLGCQVECHCQAHRAPHNILTLHQSCSSTTILKNLLLPEPGDALNIMLVIPSHASRLRCSRHHMPSLSPHTFLPRGQVFLRCRWFYIGNLGVWGSNLHSRSAQKLQASCMQGGHTR